MDYQSRYYGVLLYFYLADFLYTQHVTTLDDSHDRAVEVTAPFHVPISRQSHDFNWSKL